jgi:hypothetical protein
MKIKIETIAYQKGSNQPTPIEVFLDIDEQALGRTLGVRAFRSKRKMSTGVSRTVRATVRVLPKSAAEAAE